MKPVVTVYFSHRKMSTSSRQGHYSDRSESQCSSHHNNSDGSVSSSYPYSSSDFRRPVILPYQRYNLPIDEKFKKMVGRQFEYDFDHKWVRAHCVSHVQVLKYELVNSTREVIKIPCPCPDKTSFQNCSKCHRVFCCNKCLKQT